MHAVASRPLQRRALLMALRSGRARLTHIRAPLKGRSLDVLRRALADADGAPGDHSAVLPMQAASATMLGVDTADLRRWLAAGAARSLPPQPQAMLVEFIGRDRFGRRHWLIPAAAAAWRRLADAAQSDGIAMELVSSFRSIRDQARIVARKLRQGSDESSIYAVNAPPGFSEHHSGRAVDLAVPGEALLTDAFEHSDAYAWLSTHAALFGFALSYPRNNRYGFIHEPWHWCYHEAP